MKKKALKLSLLGTAFAGALVLQPLQLAHLLGLLIL